MGAWDEFFESRAAFGSIAGFPAALVEISGIPGQNPPRLIPRTDGEVSCNESPPGLGYWAWVS